MQQVADQNNQLQYSQLFHDLQNMVKGQDISFETQPHETWKVLFNQPVLIIACRILTYTLPEAKNLRKQWLLMKLTMSHFLFTSPLVGQVRALQLDSFLTLGTLVRTGWFNTNTSLGGSDITAVVLFTKEAFAAK